MSRFTSAAAIRAVLFDFDGTLTRPGELDFAAIRRDTGCPAGESILDYVHGLEDGPRKTRAMVILEEAEASAAASSVPRAGAERYVHALRERGVRVGIITRNSRASVERALANFSSVTASSFDILISRDDDMRYKPHPDGVLHACRTLHVAPQETVVVGDYVYDMQAALSAGAHAVYIDPAPSRSPGASLPECDLVVHDFATLERALEPVLRLPNGKVPNRLLAQYLSTVGSTDPDVLVGPGVGEDSAAMRARGVLVVKSDPITLTADGGGAASVVINANDIATAGADPRWFQCTFLFPQDTAPFQIEEEFVLLAAELRRLGIVLTGGHTEITDAVRRPVSSGTLMGLIDESAILRKDSIRAGDVLLMSGTAGIEGTAILATEFGSLLRSRGIPASEIEDAKAYTDLVSIVEPARAVRSVAGVRAMHDVTEGGFAGAVREFAQASRTRIRVDMAAVMVTDLTRRIAAAVDVDPLGLIGSGALLVACAEDDVAEASAALARSGRPVAVVGRFLRHDTEAGGEVEAFGVEGTMAFPDFTTDELARISELYRDSRGP